MRLHSCSASKGNRVEDGTQSHSRGGTEVGIWTSSRRQDGMRALAASGVEELMKGEGGSGENVAGL